MKLKLILIAVVCAALLIQPLPFFAQSKVNQATQTKAPGATGQLVYNASGVPSGDANLTWDNIGDVLSIGTIPTFLQTWNWSTQTANRTVLWPDSVGPGVPRMNSSGTVAYGTASGTGSCSNQAVTAVNDGAAPTCTTLTSAYVDTSIAKTGTDVNTSNQVTATHLAAALPILQGGTGNTAGIAGPITFGTVTAPACTNGGGTTTFVGVGSSSTTEASVIRFVAPVATTLSKMSVKLGGNVPTSETAAIKISKNGSTTSTPNCSIAAAASTCADTSTTVAVAANDLIDVSLNCSGSTTALTVSVSVTIMAQ